MKSVKITKKLLFALALLESGQKGVRQERFYPPAGVFVETCNQCYTDGNLRDQPSILKRKHGIKLLNWIDPYKSMDGRSSPYHRYAIPSRKVAEQVLALADRWYMKAIGCQLSPKDKEKLLAGFQK